LLHAALKCFAEQGYAATSVQEIVDTARVSKPVLYYYFANKADLFSAVVDSAHDERYRLMQVAAERGRTVGEKMQEIVAALFEYAQRNREVMRLTFATAFAVTADMPGQRRCREKGRRNFDFICSLIKVGQASGELSHDFSREELGMGIYGQVNSHVMIGLLAPDCPLNRDSARQIVRLFLRGAANLTTRNGHPWDLKKNSFRLRPAVDSSQR
jgi:AcrR family transcriptional regulator